MSSFATESRSRRAKLYKCSRNVHLVVVDLVVSSGHSGPAPRRLRMPLPSREEGPQSPHLRAVADLHCPRSGDPPRCPSPRRLGRCTPARRWHQRDPEESDRQSTEVRLHRRSRDVRSSRVMWVGPGRSAVARIDRKGRASIRRTRLVTCQASPLHTTSKNVAQDRSTR